MEEKEYPIIEEEDGIINNLSESLGGSERLL